MRNRTMNFDGGSVEINDFSEEVLEELNRKALLALQTCGRQARGYAVENLADAMSANQSPTWTRTGNLANRTTTKTVSEEMAAYIGTNVTYAPYIEFGTGIYAENGQGRPTPWKWVDDRGHGHFTHGQHATHYLRNAVKDHGDEYKRIFENVLKSD